MNDAGSRLEDEILNRIRGKLDYAQSPLAREAIRKFIPESPTTIFRDKLSQINGRSGGELQEEIERRRYYLEGRSRGGLRSIADVASYCDLYIRNPRKAFTKILPSTTAGPDGVYKDIPPQEGR